MCRVIQIKTTYQTTCNICKMSIILSSCKFIYIHCNIVVKFETTRILLPRSYIYIFVKIIKIVVNYKIIS